MRASALLLPALLLLIRSAPDLRAEERTQSCRYAALATLDHADTQERQYAPDRTVDLLHLELDVTPDFARRTIAGRTTIRFAPIALPLRQLRLHAVDLTIDSVEASAPILAYQNTGEELIVTFAEPLPAAQPAWVAVTHRAEPAAGLYFRTPEMGYKPEDTHLWTQGEAHEARHWYPAFDYPNERFTSAVTCRVPADMIVLSNGRKVEEETDPQTGLKVVRWLQEKPHVNYLIALAAGKFAKLEDRYGDLPLGFYTPASQIDQAAATFRPTPEMLAFYEAEIGVPFPWAQYNQVVVDDFAWGGMENTTLTVLTDWSLHTDATATIDNADGLIAHELVHQWFGDYLTCKDWSHIWLNEGFATYYENLYIGHSQGRDAFLYALYRDARNVLEQEDEKPIVYRRYADPDDQFDYRAYPKGGWVLHMLHTRLGDDLYRRIIRTYVERHALHSVVTEDLNQVVEELSGRSFDRFFDQWVYHGGEPALRVQYRWDELQKLAKLSVAQTQETGDGVLLFHLPTKVRFTVAGKKVDRDLVISAREQDFYFPLPEEPSVVRFDPEYGLLADVEFPKPKEMLYAQLAPENDAIGRLLAAQSLAEEGDRQTVEKLREALASDPFYGVRVEASRALREIHTPEALAALTASLDQPDPRARRQVVTDIAGFYHEQARVALLIVLATEENPAILARAIEGLGRYPGEQTRKQLLAYLDSDSYRDRLAAAAVAAIRALDDPDYIRPLQKSLARRESAFTSRDFAAALDALAYIARTRDERKEVRRFLAGYANHPRKSVQRAALTALGTLRDPAAIPLVESYAGSNERKDEIQQAAADALAELRDARTIPVELGELRDELLDLKENNQQLQEDLEDLQKRFEAREEGSR